MSANLTNSNSDPIAPTEARVPKRIENAQTVCSVKNEKGKLCNGHLKQLRTGDQIGTLHLRGDDVLFKCQACGEMYMGPPHGHVRDPQKQTRYTELELMSILQAAGGTLPKIVKAKSGAWVLAEVPAPHTPAAAAKPAAPPKAAPKPSAEEKPKPAPTQATAPVESLGPIPGASGPVAGETPEQKLARLKAVVAEAKRRKELLGGVDGGVGETKSTGALPTSAALAAESKPAAVSETTKSETTKATSLGPIPGAAGPVEGETREQKIARLNAVVAEAKRRKEMMASGEGGEAPAIVAAPAIETKSPVVEKEPAAQPTSSPAKAESSHGSSLGPIPGASGPVPGETHEEKLARLRAVVAEAKRRKELGPGE